MLLYKLFGYNVSWIEVIDLTLVAALFYLFYKRVRGSLGLRFVQRAAP